MKDLDKPSPDVSRLHCAVMIYLQSINKTCMYFNTSYANLLRHASCSIPVKKRYSRLDQVEQSKKRRIKTKWRKTDIKVMFDG